MHIAQQDDHGNNINILQVSQKSQRKCLETVGHYLYTMDIIFTQPSVSSYKLIICYVLHPITHKIGHFGDALPR